MGVHGAVASLSFGEKTKAVLDDHRSAPIDDRLRAMLVFLEKVTLRPEELTPGDANAVRASGCSDLEISHALYVGYLFNIYVRLADAMGWITRDEARYVKDARFLLKNGYAPKAPDTSPEEARQKLERAVLEGEGVTQAELRRAAFLGKDVPMELRALVAMTHAHAYEVTDEDITALRDRFSDDELFEVIVASSLGAAAMRIDAAFRVLANRAVA